MYTVLLAAGGFSVAGSGGMISVEMPLVGEGAGALLPDDALVGVKEIGTELGPTSPDVEPAGALVGSASTSRGLAGGE